MLYKLTQAVIIFVMIIFSIISEWLNKLIKRKGLKILTHKQMLQRLPLPFAEVKEGNNSEKY